MTPDDPHVLDPDHAPTPFTAAEIKEGCPPGRTIHILVEETGRDDYVRVNRFVAGDETGATVEVRHLDAGGKPFGPVETSEVTWEVFQSHASFPRDVVTISDETLDTPLGALACLLYTVEDEDTTSRFWFAKSLPGMPVRYETVADGTVTSRAAVIDNAYE